MQCFRLVGCSSLIKYRGRFLGAAGGEVRFAGTAKSELCPQRFEGCVLGAIETMYEQIYVTIGDELRRERRPVKSPLTTEL